MRQVLRKGLKEIVVEERSPTSGGKRVEVFGEGLGVITEDFTRLDTRTSTRRSQSKWRPDKGYAGLVNSFVNALRNGTAHPVTVRDGARATIGCLEMFESARTFAPRPLDIDRALGPTT